MEKKILHYNTHGQFAPMPRPRHGCGVMTITLDKTLNNWLDNSVGQMISFSCIVFARLVSDL